MHRPLSIRAFTGEGFSLVASNRAAFYGGDAPDEVFELIADGATPWNTLVRSLAKRIAGAQYDHPAIAIIDASTTSVSCFLFGDTSVEIQTDSSNNRLDGSEVTTWLESQVAESPSVISVGSSQGTPIAAFSEGYVRSGGFEFDCSAIERQLPNPVAANTQPLASASPNAPSAPTPPPPPPPAESDHEDPRFDATQRVDPELIKQIRAETAAARQTQSAREEPAIEPALQPLDEGPKTNDDLTVVVPHEVTDPQEALISSIDQQTQEPTGISVSEESQESVAVPSSPADPTPPQGAVVPHPPVDDLGSDAAPSEDDDNYDSNLTTSITGAQLDGIVRRAKIQSDPRRQSGAGSAAQDAAKLPMLRGVRCEAGHLNSMQDQKCRTCGAKVNSSGAFEEDVRPVLGVITFDDGSTYTLGAPIVFGRELPSEYMIGGESARVVQLNDASNLLSRIHLEIHLAG